MSNPKIKKLENMLAANDLQGAEKLCRSAIFHDRYDFRMFALLGAIQLQTGRLKSAERNLKRAISLSPVFAKPHADLAALHLQRNEFKQAESLFRKAIELDRNMKPAFLGLLDALAKQGDFAEIKDLCSRLLEKNPDDLEVMRSMAIVRVQEGQIDEAGRLFQLIVDKTPRSVRALKDLAQFHASQHQYPLVIELLKRASKIEPQNPRFHILLADYLFMTGFPEESLAAYDRGLALVPDSPQVRSGRANALRTLGRTEEVVAAYKANIRDGINTGESWWSLASLRTHEFSDNDVEAMKSLHSTADPQDLLFFEFALGKAMDDREDYDAAWKYYQSANYSRRQQVNYDTGRFQSQIDLIINWSGSEPLPVETRDADADVTPIFILGMPRSGSTLIEQILASHSMVEATTELPYMTALGERNILANENGANSSLADFGPDRLKAIGDSYMNAARMHRKSDSRCFIDKMPDNFQFAGLIAMAMPGAKIIDVRRNPMDTCIGNFRQWFGRGKEYSYDLTELGERYLQYIRVMQHWNEVTPGRILSVDYENVVADIESETRRILSWCDLPWEEDCLRFHESRRAVTTASSEQVRQPIFTSGVDFWKNYEMHLGGLAELLKPVIG